MKSKHILILLISQISLFGYSQNLSTTVRQDFCKNAIENYYYGTDMFRSWMFQSARNTGLTTPDEIKNAVDNICKNIKLQEAFFLSVDRLGGSREFKESQFISIGMKPQNAKLLNDYLILKYHIVSTEEIPNKIKKSKISIVKNGFNIPIKSDMEETKPKIYDENLEYIVFQSSAVVWKKPNEGTSVDKSEWTLTLTSKDFVMNSMNYEKKFKIMNVKYDEDFQMQKFELADETTAHAFNLLISYTLETESYNVIVQSINYKEEYQFQGVVDKEKIFKK